MRRRAVLSLVGSGAVVGLAGCSGRRSTHTAEPPASSASIEGYDCPPAAPERTAVVCSHTVDPDRAPVYLLPSERTVSSPPESLELTLHNDSDTDLAFNPYSWTLRYERPPGWSHLDEFSGGDGRLTLPGGQSHTWTLAEVLDATAASLQGPGTYTARISVPDPSGSDRLDCIALFRLE